LLEKKKKKLGFFIWCGNIRFITLAKIQIKIFKIDYYHCLFLVFSLRDLTFAKIVTAVEEFSIFRPRQYQEIDLVDWHKLVLLRNKALKINILLSLFFLILKRIILIVGFTGAGDACLGPCNRQVLNVHRLLGVAIDCIGMINNIINAVTQITMPIVFEEEFISKSGHVWYLKERYQFGFYHNYLYSSHVNRSMYLLKS
jgi:hypothetical protein